MDIKYKIVRSNRKTSSIQIKNGEVILRVPLKTTDAAAEKIVKDNRKWIIAGLIKSETEKQALESLPTISDSEIKVLEERARIVIPHRVAYYAALLGVSYGKISIRHQKGRWGSCNGEGDLSFNCLLMLTPLEVIDSVVVHELCHRKEMNHSEKFYKEVLRVYPDYRKWNDWLKKNGGILIKRMMVGKNEV